MEKDRLRLFNTNLIEPVTSMSDDELWDFLEANEERIAAVVTSPYHALSGFLFGYAYGKMARVREMFLREMIYYREGVIFTLLADFCFEGEEIELDYWARCGYLDDGDSCDTKTSDEVMPEVDDDYEDADRAEYFHLLDPPQIENIIRSMETNFEKLEKNTREDIEKIKSMKNICLAKKGYQVAYIYDV